MRAMRRVATLTICFAAAASPTRADAPDARAVVEKAVKAMGGAEKLTKAAAFSRTSKGTININGSDNPFTGTSIFQGLDKLRSEFDGEFDGDPVKGVTVMNGERAWRKFNDMLVELDGEELANEKQRLYLQTTASIVAPLLGTGFTLDKAEETTAEGKPAIAVRIKGPDSKEFVIFFDKENGLPVKQVATVIGFMGEEFEQETLYSGYKDFDGIQQATKIVSKRDGQTFIEIEITEFKILDSVKPETFSEPD